MNDESLHWDTVRRGNVLFVTFYGVLDESADFEPLMGLNNDTVVFDLAEVSRVNSVGVSLWIKALDRLTPIKRLTFQRCSLAVVGAINLVPAFLGSGTVVSVMAPYVCEVTGDTAVRQLDIDTLTNPCEPPTFTEAGSLWVLDDIPDRYFRFLLRTKG